jgi:UDP-N-acetyl-D-galactosamine dehydrogenase
MDNPNFKKICVVGLGYVGLPLAVELAKYFEVVGLDSNSARVAKLMDGVDPNGEVATEQLQKSSLRFSTEPQVVAETDVIIIAVPTPIDEHKTPDLTPVIKASESIGKYLKKGAIVCYESTVYPGVTEDECVPVLERESGLQWKRDFFVGYSPERINPGDKVHTFATITKVVAGDTAETLQTLATIYGTAVKAGIHRASSIKVAEAAKVIENTQRDINIALMNELRIIFDKMGISTHEVLKAAGTKWNFLPFSPGLVGGHCIGVDPYYLAYKAEEIGHHPQLILAGRRINDAMARYFAREIIKQLIHADTPVKGARVLVCGITFKENVPDIRNSKVVDLIKELAEFGVSVDVWDPVAYADEVQHEYGIQLVEAPAQGLYNMVVLAVAHSEFVARGLDGLKSYCRSEGGVFDMKQVLAS